MSVRNIIKASLFTPFSNGRWGLPLVLVGDPGIAKSAIVEEICFENGLECETITASDRDPTDFSGLPFPNADRSRVDRLVDDWMHRMFESKGPYVLFLDELSTLPGSVQAVCLRGVRDGVWAGRRAPAHVRSIAAMNGSDIAAGGHRISQPLANRFGWIDFPVPSVKDWAEYMMGSGPDQFTEPASATDEEKRVMERWPEAWAKAVGLMTAAMMRLPQLLFNKPENNNPEASRAWPSLRTNEYATRALASSNIHDLKAAERDMFMASFIGEPAAIELIAWQNQQDLPNPEDVLDGRIKFNHEPRRLDRTFAVLTSCTALVTPMSCEQRHDRASRMWDLLGAVADKAPDIVAAPASRLLKAGLLKGHQNAFSVLEKISDTLEAANINWQQADV